MKELKGVQPGDRSTQLRQKRQPLLWPRSDSTSAVSTSTPRKATPVVTRKPDQPKRVNQKVHAQPRRKVVYKVNADGVETRLPAIPIIHFSWQWVSGLLTIVLLLFTIILINSVIFRVNTIEVRGLTSYSADDFQRLLKGRKVSIFLFNIDGITNALNLTHPELVNTSINISMPNQVVVSASERQPVILWQVADTGYWIDAQGVIINERGKVENLLTVESSVPPPLSAVKTSPTSVIDYARMVIRRETASVTNDELLDHISPDVMKAVIDMNAIIPAGARLVYDPISGMGWRDPGGMEVYFGTDLSNIKIKQVAYETILSRLQQEGRTVSMISVEHIDAPYFRTE